MWALAHARLGSEDPKNPFNNKIYILLWGGAMCLIVGRVMARMTADCGYV